MPLTLAHPELFGVTETSATLFFGVLDASGPVDACVEVRIDGAVRAVSEGDEATRVVRINGLAPASDHPGGFAHYRLYEDGSFRQEVRRTSSPRALTHSTRCRDFFRGGYRGLSFGPLQARCFNLGGAGIG